LDSGSSIKNTLGSRTIARPIWARGQSTVADAISETEFAQHERLGTCAELCGIQLDSEGNVLTTALSERIVGIGPEQLRAVPEIVAIAYGTPKAGAVRAAVRGGFVTSLITHGSLARELLELS
jgi:DNA-binding transcriptional regulator LsrR (DeoR family)